jgi:hypothetical protein
LPLGTAFILPIFGRLLLTLEKGEAGIGVIVGGSKGVGRAFVGRIWKGGLELTFWDLLETFPVLNIAATFIIYHNIELDQIGKQLEGYVNQLWGAQGDQVLDAVYISRKLYSWLEERLGTGEIEKNLVQECMNFHKRMGIVGIDENDEVQKYFFERALLMKRREHINRVKIQSTISGVADLFEKEAYLKAEQLWEKLKAEGKILYYPPGESPLI